MFYEDLNVITVYIYYIKIQQAERFSKGAFNSEETTMAQTPLLLLNHLDSEDFSAMFFSQETIICLKYTIMNALSLRLQFRYKLFLHVRQN